MPPSPNPTRPSSQAHWEWTALASAGTWLGLAGTAVMGTTAAPLVLGALLIWAANASLTALRLWGAVSARITAAARLTATVGAMVWLTRFGSFHSEVAASAGFVTTVLTMCGLAAWGAPILAGGRLPSDTDRWQAWRDAAAAAGGFVFVGTVVLVGATRLGFAVTELAFAHLIVVAAAGVAPTALTKAWSTAAEAVLPSRVGVKTTDGVRT